MKRSDRLVATIAITGAAIAAMAAAPATAALAAPHAARSAATAKVVPRGAYLNCRAGLWCDFTAPGGAGNVAFGSGTQPSLGGLSHADQSFANRTSGLVRLYYLPYLKGDWVCIDASKYANSLAGFTFNNGPAGAANGHGLPILRGVSSIQVSPGQSCTNPLPWP
jgi:Peptidase inhibitor family I36